MFLSVIIYTTIRLRGICKMQHLVYHWGISRFVFRPPSSFHFFKLSILKMCLVFANVTFHLWVYLVGSRQFLIFIGGATRVVRSVCSYLKKQVYFFLYDKYASFLLTVHPYHFRKKVCEIPIHSHYLVCPLHNNTQFDDFYHTG